MSTIELQQAIALTSHVFRFFKTCWAAFQERRKRAGLRTELYDLSELELRDIGITRGEIEYFAATPSIDRHVDRLRLASPARMDESIAGRAVSSPIDAVENRGNLPLRWLSPSPERSRG
jgi:uncharacterized protein YjiS (DUF1127 family)